VLRSLTFSVVRTREEEMRNRPILLAALVAALAIAIPAALAAPYHAQTGGKVTVRITGTNDNGDNVTDGGIAGTGQFSASGAVADKGKCVAYRTVKGDRITLRFVSLGKRGSLTFVVRINTILGISRWTIGSGTKAYRGLHGKGIERENADFTVSTLTGTVWR